MITCATSGVGAGPVQLLVNGMVSGEGGVLQSNDSVIVFTFRTVDRSDNDGNGIAFRCANAFDGSTAEEVTLDVQCK